MSRSYRKHAIRKDNNPFHENQANRRIRRDKGYIPNGCHYKKRYCQWDICDWKVGYRTAESYIRDQQEHEHTVRYHRLQGMTDEELRINWYRIFKRK